MKIGGKSGNVQAMWWTHLREFMANIFIVIKTGRREEQESDKTEEYHQNQFNLLREDRVRF